MSSGKVYKGNSWFVEARLFMQEFYIAISQHKLRRFKYKYNGKYWRIYKAIVLWFVFILITLFVLKMVLTRLG